MLHFTGKRPEYFEASALGSRVGAGRLMNDPALTACTCRENVVTPPAGCSAEESYSCESVCAADLDVTKQVGHLSGSPQEKPVSMHTNF